MAYSYTRSRARGEVADSDIEPSDTAPSAATSPLSIFEGPSVESVEGPELVSIELAGPVSAPTHSLPAGSPPTSGSHGALGSVGPSHVGVSALRYPSGQADPLDIGGQMSTSLATANLSNRQPRTHLLRGSRRLPPPPHGCRQKVLHMRGSMILT